MWCLCTTGGQFFTTRADTLWSSQGEEVHLGTEGDSGPVRIGHASRDLIIVGDDFTLESDDMTLDSPTLKLGTSQPGTIVIGHDGATSLTSSGSSLHSLSLYVHTYIYLCNRHSCGVCVS